MQILKRQKLLLVFIVIFVVITFLSTFIITGCGRRARIIAAANEKKEQATEQNSKSLTGTVEENDESDTEETVKESINDKETIEAEESAENEDSNTSESEDSFEDEETTEHEDSIEDEETAESEDDRQDEETDESEDDIEDEETAATENSEETTAEERTKYTADMPIVRDECKNLIDEGLEWVDTDILPGDTGYKNLEVRGFISYDISQLIGTSIKSATISGQASGVKGTPVDNYGPMYIKSVFWGVGVISPSEFELNGTDITSISKSNFSKSNEILKDSLQSSVNHGFSRYQLCFYFKISQTDGDGESDYIRYPLSDLTLTVTYLK